jgi:citronellol/citronellal dehydrogenase
MVEAACFGGGRPGGLIPALLRTGRAAAHAPRREVMSATRGSASAPGRQDGRVALVTGGGTGIGRAVASELAAAGATVVIVGRRSNVLEETRQQIQKVGGTCVAVSLDVRVEDEVTRLVDEIMDRHGRVDILVNNAGGQFSAPAEEITLKGWRAVHRLSVDATWDLTQKVAVASMIPQRSGVIVFSAFSPRRGIPGFVHAASARAAVENLTAGLALEWSRYGIRTVCVAPGTIVTQGLDNYSDEDLERWQQAVPLGRLGTPHDVSAVICFLASDAAAYVTGTTVVVDGGVDAWGAGYAAPAIDQRDAL